MPKYVVTLTAEERTQPHGLIAAGKAAAGKLTHARIRRKADAAPDGPHWTADRIAEAIDVSAATVGRVCQRFVGQGLEAAPARKKQDRPSRPLKPDGRAGAQLIALACSPPPQGRAEWTTQLPADKLVELHVVDPACDETARRVLEKTRSSPGRRSSGASRRRPTPSSSARWRRPSTSTSGPSTRSGRSPASTRPAGS